MEMLAAMMSGAVGGVMARGALRRARRGLWLATLLGILGGGAAWWVLAQIGPGEKAGPLVLWHVVAGGASGAALSALAILALGRAAR
ncbi:hypothetical protein ACEWPL_015325 [Roseovarius sp. S1116L3]|uniref:hypothetical protein n=1 Tax=Roseovarius roseus TaxID=3342636 RepID=UPI003729F16E